jgi:hypothetical protein
VEKTSERLLIWPEIHLSACWGWYSNKEVFFDHVNSKILLLLFSSKNTRSKTHRNCVVNIRLNGLNFSMDPKVARFEHFHMTFTMKVHETMSLRNFCRYIDCPICEWKKCTEDTQHTHNYIASNDTKFERRARKILLLIFGLSAFSLHENAQSLQKYCSRLVISSVFINQLVSMVLTEAGRVERVGLLVGSLSSTNSYRGIVWSPSGSSYIGGRKSLPSGVGCYFICARWVQR